MSTRLSSREQYEELIDKYDTWMFDCDGVLWHGSTVIDGVVDVLKFLRSKGEFVITIKHTDDIISKIYHR